MKKFTGNALVFIFITVLVDVIGLAIILPVMPDLLTELTGSSISEAASYGGILLFLYGIMQFLFAPILGELSDQFGRRPILLLSLFGLGLDYLLHAFAPTLLWLMVGRVIAGICGSSYSVANAYVADISTPEKKAKNFGLVGAAFGLGFIIGPAIGGLVGGMWGPRAPFLIAAGLTLLNFIYGYFILPESLSKENRRKAERKNFIPGRSLLHLRKYPAFGGLLLAFFLASIAGQSLPATWSFYTMEKFDWTVGDVGISFAIVGLFVALAQAVLLGKAVKLFGEKKVIIGGFVLWFLGMFLFSVAPGSGWLYCFLLPYALGGMAGPTIQGFISNRVPKNEQGNLQGAITALVSIAAIIGMPLSAELFFFFTRDKNALYFPGAPFVLASILFAIGLVLALNSLKSEKS